MGRILAIIQLVRAFLKILNSSEFKSGLDKVIDLVEDTFPSLEDEMVKVRKFLDVPDND